MGYYWDINPSVSGFTMKSHGMWDASLGCIDMGIS